MPDYRKMRLPNGKYWWVGSLVPHDRSVSPASVIIPTDQIVGMTDEEIGYWVRELRIKAEICFGEEVANDVLKNINELSKSSLEEAERILDEVQNYSDVARKAYLAIQRHKFTKRERPKVQRRANPGYIYLLHSDHGHKIGKAKNVPQRISQFTLKLPYPVELIHTISAKDMAQAEKQLHERFAHARINGEWFALELADIAYITSLETL